MKSGRPIVIGSLAAKPAVENWEDFFQRGCKPLAAEIEAPDFPIVKVVAFYPFHVEPTLNPIGIKSSASTKPLFHVEPTKGSSCVIALSPPIGSTWN